MEHEYFEYLDILRASGITNMFGSSIYLTKQFDDLTKKEANKIVLAWMQTFSKDTPPAARWDTAIEKGLVP